MFIVSRPLWEILSSAAKFRALALGFKPERPPQAPRVKVKAPRRAEKKQQ